MSGSHTDSSESRPEQKTSVTPHVRRNPLPARVVPIASAIALAAVVISAAVATMTLGPAKDTASGSPASPSVTVSVSARSTDDRASRSGIRELPASPSASPSPSVTASSAPPVPKPAPTTKKPTPPPGGGTVTGGGSCGASYYTGGGHTADGEVFNTNDFTAANRTLPFNTRVRVTNVADGKSVVVRVNDRGPFVGGRCFDLTQAAFGAIANLSAGVITIRYEVLS